jgi:nucleotide-binding universal stress UspA family protein
MGVTARWRQRLGIPSRQISVAAEELGVDLVTLGAYGRTDLTEILLGSTAQRVDRPSGAVPPARSLDGATYSGSGGGRRGSTAEAILAEATRRGCDLIVMGTRGRRGLTSLIGGSVAEAVLLQATVPVLTVKRLHVPPDARLLSAESRMRVGDQVPVGERTH